MKNISIFCLTLDPKHEKLIERLSYIPVGLGDKIFPNNFLNDKKGQNISSKNNNYGEYTFHYWIWKNYLDKIETEWVGFCQYRKFFVNKSLNGKDLTFEELEKNVIKKIPDSVSHYDCILGKQFTVENFKLSKIVKNHLLQFILHPSALINKKKRTLKFHFDLFHGKGHLDQAINLLDEENKSDFLKFVNSRTSFNPHNMFMCKTKILKKYYDSIFPWLTKCEQIFNFETLEGYGLKRIYGFLAERYLSYWFSKNYKVIELPIIGKDLSDYKVL